MNLNLEGKQVEALVDTGSTRTYLGKSFLDLMKNKLRPSLASIRLANSSVEQVEGEIDLKIELCNVVKHVTFRLVNSLSHDCILGVDFLSAFDFEINFALDTWSLPRSDPVSFVMESDIVAHGLCAGLVDISSVQRKQVEKLVARLVKPVERIHRITSIATHTIDVEGHPPIHQRFTRVSPKVL